MELPVPAPSLSPLIHKHRGEVAQTIALRLPAQFAGSSA